MELNLKTLREDLEYLSTTKGYAFGILMDNGNMNYLQELEINNIGLLTCYLPHLDDYYYVAKRVTCLPDLSSNWMDHLYYKDETGRFALFRTYAKREVRDEKFTLEKRTLAIEEWV